MAEDSRGVRVSRTVAARQERIVAELDAEGRVEVSALSAELDVTEETIRRDLRQLEQRGLLQRAHGGAIRIQEPVDHLTAALDHEIEHLPLACAAVSLVPDGGSIYLDTSDVTESLAAMLHEKDEVRVVTSSIGAALAASRYDNLDVYNLGGEVSVQDGAQSGQWTREEIARVQVDVAFITATGFSADAHLTTRTPKLATIKRLAIEAAGTVVLCVDDDAEDGELVKYAPLDDVDVAVVSPKVPDAVLGLLRAHVSDVRIAPSCEHREEGERS